MYFILLYWKSATLIPCEKAISGVCDNREKFFFLLIGSILIVYSKIFNLWKVSFIYKTFSTNAKCYSCSFVPFYQEFCIKNCLSSTLLCLIVQGGSNKMHHRKNYHFVKWGAIFLKIFSRNLQFEFQIVPKCPSSALVLRCLTAQVPWLPECLSALRVPEYFECPSASVLWVPWVSKCSLSALECPTSIWELFD